MQRTLLEFPGIRQDWKLGAIRKPIKELMKYFVKKTFHKTLLEFLSIHIEIPIRTHSLGTAYSGGWGTDWGGKGRGGRRVI